MSRRLRTIALLMAVVSTGTLVWGGGARALFTAAADGRGETQGRATHQLLSWRQGKGNAVFTEGRGWQNMAILEHGCSPDESCEGPQGIMVPSRGPISVTFSGNFSRAPVAVRVHDIDGNMHPGSASFRPTRRGHSFSYTFVAGRTIYPCRVIQLQWKSPTGDRVRMSKATVVVHNREDEPTSFGCA